MAPAARFLPSPEPIAVTLLSPVARILQEEQAALQRRYGFSNLNALLNGPPPLASEPLKANLERYRGGYCHELNLYLAERLAARGLEPRLIQARVYYRSQEALPARTHTALRLAVEGEEWLCDAGFGTGPIAPLRLQDELAQPQESLNFRLHRETPERWLLASHEGGEWNSLYRFDNVEACLADIGVANHYSATAPASLFSANLVLTRYQDGRRLVLFNDRLMDGRSIEHLDTPERLERALLDHFRIELNHGEAARLHAVAQRAAAR